MRLKTLARFDLGIMGEWENARLQKREKRERPGSCRDRSATYDVQGEKGGRTRYAAILWHTQAVEKLLIKKRALWGLALIRLEKFQRESSLARIGQAAAFAGGGREAVSTAGVWVEPRKKSTDVELPPRAGNLPVGGRFRSRLPSARA